MVAAMASLARALRGRLAQRGEDDEALPALLDVYEHRADLNEAFPEAQGGDYGRLIEWAAGVATRRWHDPAVASLEGHARWYEANMTGKLGPPLSLDWTAIAAASAAAINPLPVTVEAMRAPPSDISHHLPLLSLLIREFDLSRTLELGVRSGVSTLAFVEAADKIGGHVTSVDVEPCLEARARVEAAGLDGRWTFLQGSDLEMDEVSIPEPIDLLFVDTTHLYEHTLAELRRFAPRVRPGGWLALHDYTSCPGVTAAVGDFLEAEGNAFRLYPFVHQNGLAVLRAEEA